MSTAAEKSGFTYRVAVREALEEEMRRDATVVLFGEDIGAAGGVFKVTEGLQREFGGLRVRDSPISENALVGTAIGCAAVGFRPVVEIMFADFLPNAFDQLVNHAAKLRYMTGGQVELPLVVRAAHGGGIRFGAQHSQAACSWVLPFPGIKVVAPATPADAKLLLKAAIRDPDPVLFLEHKLLYGVKGDPPAEGQDLPALGTPVIRRKGSNVTIVALAGTVPLAMAAAHELESSRIEAEVIDLRGLVPLDLTAVSDSVRRTGLLLVVEEEPAQGGWADRIVSKVIQTAWSAFRKPPITLSSLSCPIPYAPTLEDECAPNAVKIAVAAKALIDRDA